MKCIMMPEEDNSTLHYKVSQYVLVVSQSYSEYHPIVSLSLILIGISLGSLNLLILNFKNMVSPFNRMLSTIGIADMITMGMYAPFVIYFHIFNKCALPDGTETVGPARFLYCYIVITAVSHCASIWLAIGLSGLRLYCMKNPQQADAATWRKMTVITTSLVAMACSTSGIYVIYTTVELITLPTNSSLVKDVQHYSLNQTGAFVIGFHGVFVKLLPSVVLTVIAVFMVREFTRFKRRRKALGKASKLNSTTGMLIGVVLLFIALELPQGIIIFISAMNSIFYREIYNRLGDIVDLMTIIRTVANFFIYCSMSGMFRKYLVEILCRLAPGACLRGRRDAAPSCSGETMVNLMSHETALKSANADTESEPECCLIKDVTTLLPPVSELPS